MLAVSGRSCTFVDKRVLLKIQTRVSTYSSAAAPAVSTNSTSVSSLPNNSNVYSTASPTYRLALSARLPRLPYNTFNEKSRWPTIQLLKEASAANNMMNVGQPQELYKDLLEETISQLTSRREIIIGVLSTPDLVTSLLSDPISTDSEYVSSRLNDRLGKLQKDGFVTIRYSEKESIAQQDSNDVLLPVPWMRKVGLKFIEASKPVVELEKCDIFIVSAPFDINIVKNKGRPILYLARDTNSTPSESLNAAVQQDEKDLCNLPPVLPYPKQMAVSISSSKKDDDQDTQLSQFLDNYRSSGLSAIADYLTKLSQASFTFDTSKPHRLQLHTAYALSSLVISNLYTGVAQSVNSLKDVHRELSLFLDKVEKEVSFLQLGKLQVQGLDEARAGLESTLEKKLPWWKLAWKIDNIGPEMKSFINWNYLADFEKRLAYESGRLNSLSMYIARQTQQFIDKLGSNNDQNSLLLSSASLQEEQDLIHNVTPYSAFNIVQNYLNSPVIKNSLQQAALSAPSYSQRDTLGEPLIRRRNQLVQPGGPIDMLALRSQKLVMTFYINWLSTSGLSVLLYWANYVENWIGCTGLALFGFSFAARGLQKGWKKAQARFWGDWDRVAQGLQVDLTREVEKSIQEAAWTTPRTLEKGIVQNIYKRRKEIDAVRDRLNNLTAREGERIKEANS